MDKLIEEIQKENPFLIGEGFSKRDIQLLALMAVETVLEKGNPTVVAEQMAVMENYIKAVKGDRRFTDYVREELAKNGGKIISASGAKMEACEGGISYDYSANPAWVELEQTIATLEVQKKQLETRLRAIPQGRLLIDEESGETLIGPARKSTSTYKVTLAG